MAWNFHFVLLSVFRFIDAVILGGRTYQNLSGWFVDPNPKKQLSVGIWKQKERPAPLFFYLVLLLI
jgi:hypothetical protein